MDTCNNFDNGTSLKALREAKAFMNENFLKIKKRKGMNKFVICLNLMYFMHSSLRYWGINPIIIFINSIDEVYFILLLLLFNYNSLEFIIAATS